VVEGSRQPRLDEEALAKVRIFGQLRSEQLERHRPLERQVVGAVDDAHAAAADELLQPIARDLPARDLPADVHARAGTIERRRTIA
jgi:hypothetical protein